MIDKFCEQRSPGRDAFRPAAGVDGLDRKILVVDDELSMREFLEILFSGEGYRVDTAGGGKEAVEKIGDRDYHVVITDIQMPGVDGIEVLRKAKEVSPGTEVIMMTAFASTETAVEAMKCGAYDYITKPFKIDEIKLVIEKAFEKIRLESENILLKKELKEGYNFGDIIGVSSRMLEIYNMIKRVAPTKSTVLITGESGTGKEMVAKSIHANSPRCDKPFITVNCGAMPENLLESELFGHKKGAFTGAVSNKQGLFELADGGSIFLDEIGEMPPSLQVKLLRVLQEKEFRRVGDTRDIRSDVRIIAATNRDLEEAVKSGAFREDLYYRLNVIQIKLPPLRERREDIPSLTLHFLNKYNRELGREIKKVSSEAMEILQNYNYPGNVRELENIIERAVALEQSDIILPESLPEEVSRRSDVEIGVDLDVPPGGLDLETLMEDLEKRFLLKALARAGGVKTKAAELLGLSFRSFRYRLAKYGLDDEEH